MKKRINLFRILIIGAWTICLIPLVTRACKGFTKDDPKFKKGDTVENFKSHMVYILDSVTFRPTHRQVFYNAHDLTGAAVTWLPENSIKPFRKY